MPRLIMHVDMDAFFAAIEQRDHPEYRGRPVIVGARPGTRGVVSTCSYEARAYGVRSAMPISEAFERCPHAIYLRPNMTLYSAVSDQLMEIVGTISPALEPLSVDEAFLDITGLEKLFGTPEAIGRRTKELIRSRLSLSASVGIGPNRAVAKLASDFRKPDGLTVVMPHQVLSFLAPMPVSRLSGVGRRTRCALEQLGVTSVAQLREMPLESLQRHFGNKGGIALYDSARGIASDVVGCREVRQSISKETTFNQDVVDQEILHDTLLQLASEVGAIARREGLAGRVVTVKIRLKGFETHTRQRRLTHFTDNDRVIFAEGWGLYQASGYAGRPIRLIGIGITDWDTGAGVQRNLFDQPAGDEREKCLLATVDRIRERHGKGAIGLGLPRRKGN